MTNISVLTNSPVISLFKTLKSVVDKSKNNEYNKNEIKSFKKWRKENE